MEARSLNRSTAHAFAGPFSIISQVRRSALMPSTADLFAGRLRDECVCTLWAVADRIGSRPNLLKSVPALRYPISSCTARWAWFMATSV
jgi:hypothetical protein